MHLSGGQLARSSRDGIAGSGAGVLDDYACVADGFLALSGVTGDARWVTLAGELLDTVLESFGDGNGGFFDTAAGAERLIYRPADPADNATPSGTFAAAGALLSYAALTGSARHRDAALAALAGPARPSAGSRGPQAGVWPWPRACWPGRPRSPSSARRATNGPATCSGPPWKRLPPAPCWPSGMAPTNGTGPDGTGPDGKAPALGRCRC